MTLKEKYWKDGYVFQFRKGGRRVVLGEKLIDVRGYIHISMMSDNLIYESMNPDEVVAVYQPTPIVECISDLLKGGDAVWQISDYIMTIDEIKEKLNIPLDYDLVILYNE